MTGVAVCFATDYKNDCVAIAHKIVFRRIASGVDCRRLRHPVAGQCPGQGRLSGRPKGGIRKHWRNGAGCTIIGAVDHPNVPWVEGLTLAQAIATANYTSHRNPKTITITRQGEEISVNPRDLIGGHVVSLQPGDKITIQ